MLFWNSKALFLLVAICRNLSSSAWKLAPSSITKQSLPSRMPPLAFAAGVLKDEPAPTTPIERFYPIGTPGQPWSAAEDKAWRDQTKWQRSYQEEVVKKIKDIIESETRLESVQYGALSHNPNKYPLYAVQSKDFDTSKPTVLITGGVHGYETSGVQGALQFLETTATQYLSRLNLIVAPCVSPWSYEHIQRWQHDVLDPNRSFGGDGSTEESKALISHIRALQASNNNNLVIQCHLDLHETTDTDATEFMPAKHAKAGMSYSGETIPDGFYLVGDSEQPQLDFHSAILKSVQKVTHIAPPDDNGEIIEVPLAQEGLILVPIHELGLCASLTKAPYSSTTEVYPDSPQATDQICKDAQVAAIVGAIDFILQSK